MIAPGDIAPRRDGEHELYVAVLSNAIHLAADTGRVITCPFIPGRVPDDAIAMVVAVEKPEGTLLPELVQWLPLVALDEPIGTIGVAALRETATIVAALIS
ncbi:MAG: toxin [Mycobacterium sp.]